MRSALRFALSLSLLAVMLAVSVQFCLAGGKQEAAASASNAGGSAFYLHAKHVDEVGLDCNACHVATKEGSVTLQRPGHDQCMACHQDAFDNVDNQKICTQCHTAFPPTSAEELYPFPRFKNQRPILVDFNHSKHVDPHARVDQKTGFRADCSFCHQPTAKGTFTIGHEQCAGCHSKPGMKPNLSATSTSDDCKTCHNPQAIENPSLLAGKPMVPAHIVSGHYKDIRFSHQSHFGHKINYDMNCTTCHRDVSKATSLAGLDLPKMNDCATCHNDKLAAGKRMDSCGTCHANPETGVALASYSRWIKPAFHTESFRSQHQDEASKSGATCYMCHNGVQASATGNARCTTCHQTMRPASHTARWRDDVHGKFAAIDREQCSTCHVADTCTRCHNETPRSHEPLAFFKGGAHAQAAKLNERSCLTCHTYENTCSECHSRSLR
jgi:hypothetical protein